ncbi:MAG: FKBP-type peptidyl-prolyl cis-trans isomerase [Opitutae bacterium]|nr:FKBP-type peptidyl-prolyl cis-trans isomerase [Opitutae bacterium]
MIEKIIPIAGVLALAPFCGAFAQDAEPESTAATAAVAPVEASAAEVAATTEEKTAELSQEKRSLYLKILGCYFAAQNGLDYADLSADDKAALAEGFALGLDGKFKDFESQIEENSDEMGAFVQNFQEKIRATAESHQRAELKKIADENKAKGAAYMEKCKEEGGYTFLESGVLVKVEKAGDDSVKPTPESYISVRYTGKLVDGTIFDSSERSDEGLPVQFTEKSEAVSFPMPLGQLIPGWVEALPTLGKGAKATLVIPSELAYGDEPGRLPAGSTLVFDVELVDVVAELPEQADAEIVPSEAEEVDAEDDEAEPATAVEGEVVEPADSAAAAPEADTSDANVPVDDEE